MRSYAPVLELLATVLPSHISLVHSAVRVALCYGSGIYSVQAMTQYIPATPSRENLRMEGERLSRLEISCPMFLHFFFSISCIEAHRPFLQTGLRKMVSSSPSSPVDVTFFCSSHLSLFSFFLKQVSPVFSPSPFIAFLSGAHPLRSMHLSIGSLTSMRMYSILTFLQSHFLLSSLLL